jgi:hypothetical protein
MKRLLMSCVTAMAIVATSAAAAQAEVKTRDKDHVKIEGMLGRMAGMFGGKAMKEGVVSMNAVKGNRKVTITDTMGRIVDLSEEKIYDLDMKKKTYEVMTFEQVRQQIREAQERAAKEAQKQERPSEQQAQPQQSGKEVEVDFDVKETGQKKSIAGHEAREVVMTITVREKGKTLEEAGGLVVTSDSWLGPDIPAMKELAEFEMRYWKAIAPETAGVSAEQMAVIVAMYPMLKQGMERLNQEKATLQGTMLASTTTFEAVKSPDQMAQQKDGNSGGGLGGMLARRMMKKNESARATIFTITSEKLEIATTVAPGDLEIPAGFKQKN